MHAICALTNVIVAISAQADGNSSEEESDEAIIMPAPSPSTLNDECIADDDSVLLLTSEEEAKLSEDITIGGDSPCRHGSPISSPRDLSSPKVIRSGYLHMIF